MLLISPNFAVKPNIFPNFGQGHFPKIAGKALNTIKKMGKTILNFNLNSQTISVDTE